MSDPVVIYITAKDTQEGRVVADKLLAMKLAACVNLIGNVESVFHWKGKIDREREVLLVVKSARRLLPEITEAVKSVHSYDTPEIIALPVIGGDQKYLDWLEESLTEER